MTRSVILFAVALVGAPATAVSFQSGCAESWTWGSSSHGLRIGILPILSEMSSPVRPGVRVALQNTSDSDFVINLGEMLGNGKSMMLSAVRLVLTRPGAASRELQFVDRRYSGVGGRIDNYIVYLRAGSTYSSKVTLSMLLESRYQGVRLVSG
jgi:hypothetical protein